MFKRHFQVTASTLLLTLNTVFLSVPIPAMAGADPACDGGAISSSQIDTTLRRVGEATGEPQCYDTYVPGPGLLLLNVDVSSMDGVEPRLDPMDSCNRDDALDHAFNLANRTPTSLVAEIRRAGRFQFCIAAQDPEQALGTYRLSNLFVSTVVTKEGDPTENEPDPDPLVFVSAHGELRRACVRGLEDDYSDTFRCAGPLTPAKRVYGWLGNAWNDDADVFVLEVEEMTTVRLGTTGTVDTLGALYDRFGQRLAMDDDGGEGGNFRLVKTLVGPGRYFVRVEGRNGSEGAYQLELDLLDPILVGDQ